MENLLKHLKKIHFVSIQLDFMGKKVSIHLVGENSRPGIIKAFPEFEFSTGETITALVGNFPPDSDLTHVGVGAQAAELSFKMTSMGNNVFQITRM